jgi:hypothetical protein
MNKNLPETLKPQSLWRHGDNQHRVVFSVREGIVYYGSRGGNILNNFTQGETCKVETYLATSNFIRFLNDQEWEKARKDLIGWVISNNL